MDRQPFRFAIQATNASSARDWREFACKVEDLGYSTLFLADHYLGPGPAQRAAHTPRQDLAPIAAIATAAAHTTTLRVGCRVFCIDYHVPAVLAKEVATLDLLSDGRLELGHRRGLERPASTRRWALPSTPRAGGSPSSRRSSPWSRRTAPATNWRSAGDYVNVNGYKGTPPPVQRPHPPIMIGGGASGC